jgi:ubiquinone biosynthesis protein
MPIVRKAAGVALGAREVVRDLGRLQQIVGVLARHGLGWLVASVDVPGIGLLRRIAPDQSPQQPTPERLCAVIRDLGPTFVKLGQVLSTRDDIIPTAYLVAFQSLWDDVGPFSFEEVCEQIRSSLGGEPLEVFASFDEQPVAAASIAQVHRARTQAGDDVAVKVQRPGIRVKIHTDLSILEFLARSIESQLPEARVIDLPGVIGVLRDTISRETDFVHEGNNTDRFRQNFKDVPYIVIPKVYKEYVAQDVLCLEFIDGVRIAQARDAGFDMKRVGEHYIRAAFKMLLDDGFFHGDMHPGNVFVLPGERIALLDFGMTGRLTAEMRENLIDIFFALQRRDYRTIARVYWELAIKPHQVNYQAWEADVHELMETQIAGKPMAEVQISDFVGDLLRRAHSHRVRASPEYTMFFKALLTTEGLAKMLIPEIDPLEEMQPYVARMVRQQYSAKRLKEEAFHFLTAFRYSARRLPLVTAQVVSDLQEGRLRLRTVVETSPEDRRQRWQGTRHMSIALVFCGLFIGSALAMDAPGPKLLGVSAPALLGYLLSLPVLGTLLVSLMWSRRD